MQVLITGAGGFLGKAVTELFLDRGYEVIAQSRSIDKMPDRKGLRKVASDIKQIRNIQNIQADIFYHFAWEGPSGEARANTSLQLENALWTVECLKAAKDMGCKRFVGAGSIMEEETFAACNSQDSRPGLGYIYGTAKLAAHCMSKAVAADIGIDHIWAKITNAYGPGEVSPRFINTTIRKIINNEPVQFTAATQNYDFVYITDLAEAFYRIGLYGKPFRNYLIGSSNAKPLKKFLLEMKESLCPDKEFLFGDIPFSGVNLPLEVFDCSQTEQDTGFKAKISFAEGTYKTMQWLREG